MGGSTSLGPLALALVTAVFVASAADVKHIDNAPVPGAVTSLPPSATTVLEREEFYVSQNAHHADHPAPHNWLYNYVDRIVVATLQERREHMRQFLDHINVDAILFDVHLGSEARESATDIEARYIKEMDRKFNGGTKLALVHTKRDIAHNGLAAGAERLFFFEDDLAIDSLNVTDLQQRFANMWSVLPPRWNIFNFGRCYAFCDKQIQFPHNVVQDLFSLCHQSIIFDNVTMAALEDVFTHHLLPLGADVILGRLMVRGQLVTMGSKKPIFHQARKTITSTLFQEGDARGNKEPPVCMTANTQRSFRRNKLKYLGHPTFDLFANSSAPTFRINVTEAFGPDPYEVSKNF
ncbi:uncharacterized protein MONBRDRAFT_24079 [Monosiga brevicollis MX1]|uniref:Uncharacterized protein n=1 Tax=Monosiga brevicollis TaxID=81824 RepID=A9UUM8_MONBE|nr:uncharacterized protein MONBRDRAFT_24079 [Monosiga brevicollis MX1]EDQ90928.1 predicted protein [Monosiga brevicollis MX1]|eukprot:XP_001744225.1 hypothetical protein [Monosiga brevicollis MX1]